MLSGGLVSTAQSGQYAAAMGLAAAIFTCASRAALRDRVEGNASSRLKSPVGAAVEGDKKARSALSARY